MPAIGEVSNQPNVRPGNFDSALFKAQLPGHPAVGKAKVQKVAKEAGKIKAEPASAKVAGAVSAVKNNVSLPLKAIGVVRNATNAAASYLQKTSPVIRGIKSTKYLSLVTLPFGVYDFFSAGKDFVKGSNLDQRLDAGLRAISEMSGLMFSAITVGEGLTEVGVVAKSAINWTTKLTVISAALSVSSIILTIRSLWQTCHFRNELIATPGMTKSETNDLKDYVQTLEYLKAKDDAFLKKHFKVDGGKLKEQLDRIDKEAQKVLKSGDDVAIKETGQKLQKTMAALRGRVSDKIVSNSLSLVSSNVSLVALGILLTQPPLAPIGYSILAVSSAMSVGAFIFEEVRKRRFETEIGLREPKPAKVEHPKDINAKQHLKLMAEMKRQAQAVA